MTDLHEKRSAYQKALREYRIEYLEKTRTKMTSEREFQRSDAAKVLTQQEFMNVGWTIDYYSKKAFNDVRMAISTLMGIHPHGDDEAFDYYPGAFEVLSQFLTEIMALDYSWSPDTQNLQVDGHAMGHLYEELPYDMADNIEWLMGLWGYSVEFDEVFKEYHEEDGYRSYCNIIYTQT